MANASDFLTGGWEGFSTPEQDAAAQQVSDEGQERRSLDQYDDDCAIRDCFTQGSGPAALAVLRRLTIDQPCFNPEVAVNPNQFGFLREGQNSVVREIEKRMKRAELGPPTVNRPDPVPAIGEEGQ